MRTVGKMYAQKYQYQNSVVDYTVTYLPVMVRLDRGTGLDFVIINSPIILN